MHPQETGERQEEKDRQDVRSSMHLHLRGIPVALLCVHLIIIRVELTFVLQFTAKSVIARDDRDGDHFAKQPRAHSFDLLLHL